MFAERLKELREKYNLSQVELGKVLNITSQAISNYEKGKREPQIAELITLAEYFGVSVDYLVGKSSAIYEQKKTIYYSLIESIEVQKTTSNDQIERIIRGLANGKEYSWSKHKKDLIKK